MPLSSQIEGTQSSLADRFLYEIDIASAWWGTGSSHRVLRSSYAFQLPATFDAGCERACR